MKISVCVIVHVDVVSTDEDQAYREAFDVVDAMLIRDGADYDIITANVDDNKRPYKEHLYLTED